MTHDTAAGLRTALAAVSDLFFASRLASLAGRQGVDLSIVRSESAFAEQLARRRPTLVLVDLGARDLDAVALIRAAKGAGAPRVVAFGPHKDLAARAAALAAGADQWVTNQRLAETFADLLSGA